MKYRYRAAAGLALWLGLAVQTSSAHVPIARCHVDGTVVTCKGGYDDGSLAIDTPIAVIDAQERVLFSGKLDARAQFSFELPEGDFYILMDSGVGHTAEVDRRDIQGI